MGLSRLRNVRSELRVYPGLQPATGYRLGAAPGEPPLWSLCPTMDTARGFPQALSHTGEP